MEHFQKEIQFYNEKIIDGHITTDGQNGFQYSNRLGMENVPMYLTSSMVNEVAPLFLVMTSKIIMKDLLLMKWKPVYILRNSGS